MGRFTYDPHTAVEFDDRLLAHLQIVIGSKLRRGECFFFTWKDDVSLGSGRKVVWMHQGASLTFKFHGSRAPRINPLWTDALAKAANSPGGMYVMREPEPDADPVGQSALVG
ncbi:ATP-dependent DNA ligase [Microbacterium caowuchunii]|uniref:ATP-dependent DNA ligase n=1 Tax=Microbacterium caowuchunii TaxID=2614638 RepID=A0A5J6KVY7_9MICO|nr:ATP-dependent DNA ligase [Microbacterium caowuchunii]KAA9132868.1 ATP-dependent DNA ligase [Microbacterium caowuchunii]QEV99448.1 ATP-dependent DNA ligase [Microbacterium caowuchunii]